MSSSTYPGYIPVAAALTLIEQLTPDSGRRSHNFIRHAVKSGRLRAVRVGERCLLVNADDVRALVTPVVPGGDAA